MSAHDLPIDHGTRWHDVDDGVLLRRAAQQEPGAVEAIVMRHGDRLCGFLTRLLHDAAWAEDLTQETLLRALRDAVSYDPRWPLRTWLFRIR